MSDAQLARRPLVDHHTHAWSQGAAALLATLPDRPVLGAQPIDVDDVIADLDEADVERAAVISVAFWFASSLMNAPEDSAALVDAENDRLADGIRRYPMRLVGFCGFNPLTDDALDRLEKCAATDGMTGIKLHFANSQVDLANSEHLARIQAVFRAANARGLPVIAHLWTGRNYGRAEATLFIEEVLPQAPDIVVQIAHLSGSGPGYSADAAVAVYAEAAQRNDERLQNVWLDVATIVTSRQTPEELDLIASRLRQLGLPRVLFGSDSARDINPPAGTAWEDFLRLPLTDAEFRTIAANVAPYIERR